MERYTPQIVAQQLIKLLCTIVQIVRTLLFGTRRDYTHALNTFWTQGGVFSYRGIESRPIATIALFPYRNRIVKYSIHELKFYNQRHYARTYGTIVAEYLIELLAEYALMHNVDQPILCFVPSHAQRKRERGCEPNHLILQHALRSGLEDWVEYMPRAITKHRNSPRQSRSKHRQERHAQPRGAFHITNTSRIAERDVILFDDVYTTGATLDECTRVLKQARAQRIIRITLAH